MLLFYEMPKSSVNLGDVELKLCRCEMALRGLNTRGLAQRAGVNMGLVQDLLCGHYSSWPVRAAINRALRRRIFKKPARVYRPRRTKGAKSEATT